MQTFREWLREKEINEGLEPKPLASNKNVLQATKTSMLIAYVNNINNVIEKEKIDIKQVKHPEALKDSALVSALFKYGEEAKLIKDKEIYKKFVHELPTPVIKEYKL